MLGSMDAKPARRLGWTDACSWAGCARDGLEEETMVLSAAVYASADGECRAVPIEAGVLAPPPRVSTRSTSERKNHCRLACW